MPVLAAADDDGSHCPIKSLVSMLSFIEISTKRRCVSRASSRTSAVLPAHSPSSSTGRLLCDAAASIDSWATVDSVCTNDSTLASPSATYPPVRMYTAPMRTNPDTESSIVRSSTS